MTVQLSSTRGYCGGGNVAGILGLSPFSSPLQEYFTITGELPREVDEAKERFFRRRKALEPFAAECFTLATGLRIVANNHRYDDAEFPWMKAEIDFEPEADESTGETKTVHPSYAWMWGDPESEDPPYYVTAQAMHGLGVTRRQRCYVHALIGLDDDRIYIVERDEKLIADMREHCRRFWKYHIEPRRQPPPSTVEDLERLYPRDTGRSVEASTEVQRALEDRARAVLAIKRHEAEKKIEEFKIKEYMRDATTLTVGGMHVASWKQRIDGVRVFRTR